jgi:hypothetical protein
VRVQTGNLADTNLLKTLGYILKNEGVAGLFSGVSAGIYSSAISSAVFCVACKEHKVVMILQYE